MEGADLSLFKEAQLGTPVMVDTLEGLHRLVREELAGCRELAFDCEMHAFRSYHGLLCLLQLSTGEYSPLDTTMSFHFEIDFQSVVMTTRSS